ncbi:MAG: DEAD/DEAH box helicase family protein [Firmicutes bacterium]|nr:DEAD/DEAH box helicase family protein [Bacillota bacterium]
MELKVYQQQVLSAVDTYLQSLRSARSRWLTLPTDMQSDYDYPHQAWKAVRPDSPYHDKRTGTGAPLPHFCLKVPTGGGKTLLAVHTLDHIHGLYREAQTGLVLWIVPTNQIYRQTLSALRDRQHPYRQFLDVATGGRVRIVEKTDRFGPQDVDEQLVILLLMLPSANRRDKETLKVFQDAGVFDAFFPPETAWDAHERLLSQVPNLDYFGDAEDFRGRQVKTSLGNVLRLLQPVIILDEGQKAYSEGAQSTIRGFNPALMVELSATPPVGSNILVEIKGRDLDQEEMIKLDLHIANKASGRWMDTLAESVAWRNQLEEDALQYAAESGHYIRPIALIQVERTGKDQVHAGFIHAEHVVDELVQTHLVPREQIAVKSSEQDDIEGIDLLAPACPIRYIITKQALQEGWDCAFAYVLTVLTNPTSQTGITQLVGRILRQPDAQKTRVKTLDESYVFCFQQKADTLLRAVKRGLEGEGLGDLAHGIVLSDADDPQRSQQIGIREKFKRFEGTVYLPKFYVQEGDRFAELQYDSDLIARIDWTQVSLASLESLPLQPIIPGDFKTQLGYEDTGDAMQNRVSLFVPVETAVDPLFLSRRLLGEVPNPWVAYDMAVNALDLLHTRYPDAILAGNMGFIAEELIKIIVTERNRLCEDIFKDLVQQGQLQFVLVEGKGYQIPSHITVPHDSPPLLDTTTGRTVQMSLFDDPVPAADFNALEASVALYLDKQETLLWWWRNIARQNYYVQGWQKNKIYADFIAAKKDEQDPTDYGTVYVLETKGSQLANNADTIYKEEMFRYCTALGERVPWQAIANNFPAKQVRFQLIHDEEWQRMLNALFQ